MTRRHGLKKDVALKSKKQTKLTNFYSAPHLLGLKLQEEAKKRQDGDLRVRIKNHTPRCDPIHPSIVMMKLFLSSVLVLALAYLALRLLSWDPSRYPYRPVVDSEFDFIVVGRGLRGLCAG